ncbi:MAG: iron-sulfur cluster repair di-iron protein, ric [Eubacteriales bacterium]|jgi:regulator of cell morphogenesis and NO signaling|nr:iron-sulfur cluster repair di-iron protein, ric [Eubacteriales bacterium]MDD4105244.1 iron-sulfur cluster repair di-iron protein, ric [Eubacteriales bacterium]MDD4711672.1 iron-sulfur cluster repair di-iron protein, ric [Eubacteriales bacterium]NLO14544.1 iron-sulfur cluster repair di-iron protein, ric [Clostridiales bacterium]
MKDMNAFELARKQHMKTLAQFVPIVDRVHGSNHPEFHEVRALTESIISKSGAAGSMRPQLDEEFARLRAVTHDYRVPGDVCESYEAVYNMLKQLDTAYNASNA